MLMLLFRVGAEPWAIATSEVREVVPLVTLQGMPRKCSDSHPNELSGSDAWRAGFMTYRGETVPVVDVSALVSDRAAGQTLSTRIVVVASSDLSEEIDFGQNHFGQSQGLLGLMVAEVSEIAQLSPVANVPIVNRYIHSAWQSADGQNLIYRLATERVATQMYSSEIDDFSDAGSRPLQPLETAFQPQAAARALNNGFSLKGA